MKKLLAEGSKALGPFWMMSSAMIADQGGPVMGVVGAARLAGHVVVVTLARRSGEGRRPRSGRGHPAEGHLVGAAGSRGAGAL